MTCYIALCYIAIVMQHVIFHVTSHVTKICYTTLLHNMLYVLFNVLYSFYDLALMVILVSKLARDLGIQNQLKVMLLVLLLIEVVLWC